MSIYKEKSEGYIYERQNRDFQSEYNFDKSPPSCYTSSH